MDKRNKRLILSLYACKEVKIISFIARIRHIGFIIRLDITSKMGVTNLLAFWLSDVENDGLNEDLLQILKSIAMDHVPNSNSISYGNRLDYGFVHYQSCPGVLMGVRECCV